MARTIHGNLTGRAASIELREQREKRLEDDLHEKYLFAMRFEGVIKQLSAIDPHFDEWWDSYPSTTSNGEMLVLAEARIKQLQNEAEFDMLAKTFDRLDDFAEAQDLLKAARAIRAYWDMSLSDKKQVEQYCMEKSGYESGQETRRSLGL